MTQRDGDPCPACGGAKDRRAKRCSACARAGDRERLAEMGKDRTKKLRPVARAAVLAKARATAVRAENGCLLPTAWTVRGDGYVRVSADGRQVLLHRLVAEDEIGRELVDPESVDHACHNDSGCEAGMACVHRRCIEPSHLQVLANRVENWRLGTQGVVSQRRRKTHCPAGHPLSGDNLYVLPSTGARSCKACHAARQRARSQS